MYELDKILLESMLREDHAEAMTENFDNIDTFIQDQISDDEIIDAVMDGDDYDKLREPSSDEGSMFSVFDD